MKTLPPRVGSLGSRSSSAASGWRPDAHRGNRHQRGYGSEWEKTRTRILERDSGICQPGLELGELHRGSQVDHVVSRAEARALGWTHGRTEADENLQAICEACHGAKTARESRKGGA